MSGVDASAARFDVSVVIPLFDKAEYIAATLASVLRQSHQPREILVVDDGSTDGGPAIVHSLEGSGAKLITQPNQGPGQARNRGVAEAQGEWVALLDGDDLWLDDHLAELARLHRRHPGVPVLSTSYRELDEEPGYESATAVAPATPCDFFELPAGGRNISSSSVALRADVFRDAGGFASFWPGEDIDLWVRLGLEHEVAVSPRVTALYRRSTGGLTEQYFAGGRTLAPPFLDHLDRALGDARFRDRYRSIRSYRDRWSELLARQALRFGDRPAARRHLSRLAQSTNGTHVLRALALLPGPLLRLAAIVRSAISNRRLRRKS